MLRICTVQPLTSRRRTALFDSHALFADMYAHPKEYLNGTAPLNVTGAVHACVYDLNEPTSDPGNCTTAVGTDQDSFLWCVPCGLTFDPMLCVEAGH